MGMKFLSLDEDHFEDTPDDIRMAQARRAINRMREQALRAGIGSMTLDEINEEISAARFGNRPEETQNIIQMKHL